MIATIRGTVSEKIGESVVVELGGLGYEVVLTAADWGALAVGREAKFYIYDHVREDNHTLFGFTSLEAKELFMKLLGVSGVGPKVAMQVMGAATPERLSSALATGDVELLKGVSGVGKKTAERIMVELRGKVSPGATGVAAGGDAAYQALIGLGYSAPQAAQAVAAIPVDITEEQARVKAALKQLT